MWLSEGAAGGVWGLLAILSTTGIAGYSANWDHFTWWYQATFDAIAIAGSLGFAEQYFFFFQTLSCLIITSVYLMSIYECTVFRDTYHDVGAEVYIPGDFQMHYAPGLIDLFLTDFSRITYDLGSIVLQIWCAFGLFLVWNFFHDPWDVYGCDLPESLIVFLPYCLACLLTGISNYFYYHSLFLGGISHKRMQ